MKITVEKMRMYIDRKNRCKESNWMKQGNVKIKKIERMQNDFDWS